MEDYYELQQARALIARRDHQSLISAIPLLRTVQKQMGPSDFGLPVVIYHLAEVQALLGDLPTAFALAKRAHGLCDSNKEMQFLTMPKHPIEEHVQQLLSAILDAAPGVEDDASSVDVDAFIDQDEAECRSPDDPIAIPFDLADLSDQTLLAYFFQMGRGNDERAYFDVKERDVCQYVQGILTSATVDTPGSRRRMANRIMQGENDFVDPRRYFEIPRLSLADFAGAFEAEANELDDSALSDLITETIPEIVSDYSWLGDDISPAQIYAGGSVLQKLIDQARESQPDGDLAERADACILKTGIRLARASLARRCISTSTQEKHMKNTYPQDPEAQAACDDFFSDFRQEFASHFQDVLDTDPTKFEQMFAGTWQAIVLECFDLGHKFIAGDTDFHRSVLRAYQQHIDEVFRPFLIQIAQHGMANHDVPKESAINYTYSAGGGRKVYHSGSRKVYHLMRNRCIILEGWEQALIAVLMLPFFIPPSLLSIPSYVP